MSLKITITGSTNTGKTTIAAKIAQLLHSEGFTNVTNEDIDVRFNGEPTNEKISLCLSSLAKKNEPIVIKTEQCHLEYWANDGFDK